MPMDQYFISDLYAIPYKYVRWVLSWLVCGSQIIGTKSTSYTPSSPNYKVVLIFLKKKIKDAKLITLNYL